MAAPVHFTQPQQRRLTRSSTISQIPSDALDGDYVPSSLSHVADFLRVAKEIEHKNPRVAYLCRFHAFEKAHRSDPKSRGRGVRQFKTALIQRLEKDDERTKKERTEPSDARELQKFYQAFQEDIKHLELNEKGDLLAKAYQTAAVLFEVLCAVNNDEVEPEMRAAGEDVKEKHKIYSAYNILPLDRGGSGLAIMELEEIQAAVDALRITKGLLWPPARKSSNLDILDWLQVIFGFQTDNVSNQREHLILLLANIQARTDPILSSKSKVVDLAISKLLELLFENYNKWCIFHKRASYIRIPANSDGNQHKLLYMGLYLLIWGEAANVRFMPECICYIFHMMSSQLYLMLASPGHDSDTMEKIMDTYAGKKDSYSFLTEIITPIYNIIQKEAANNKKGTAPHSAWRNYDDLNEFFWSEDCFKLKWPPESNAEFFQTPALSSKSKQRRLGRTVQKVNFVEVRSFWHLFRSFDRLWSFYILALQAMVIIAWTRKAGTPFELFDVSILKNVLSIFITAAMLRVVQALVDITLNFKTYNSWKHMLRPLLKLLVAVAWVIVLPICYVHSWESSNGILSVLQHWLKPKGKLPSLYISAIAVYLLPNMISAVLFMFPFARHFLEKSNSKVFELLVWWSRPRLYVGSGMQEGPFSLLKYAAFWIIVLIAKVMFSYFIQIEPLVKLTKGIVKVTNINYEWHELFPHATNNIGAVIAIWAPIILVYFMDTQIWYSLMSTLWGGFRGAYLRLGEIRTLGMLRSRFALLPEAFNDCLVSMDNLAPWVPVTDDDVDSEIHGKKLGQAKFTWLWNKVIESFRQEDLISDKEFDLLWIPFSSFSEPTLDMDMMRWPAFLLASKVPDAVNIAADFDSKDQDPAKLWKRIIADEYRKAAVEECYKMFLLILDLVIVGERERRIKKSILNEVDKRIEDKTFLRFFKMKKLQLLVDKFVGLISVLLEKEDGTKHGKVVIILQDMLEVIQRDMADNYSFDDESESFHKKISNPIAHKQLFANLSPPAINHSLPSSPAWEAQMKRLYLLLTDKESALDVPTNLEARRRINFFTNSLFMDMPKPPPVRKMVSFSVLTPYYEEDTIYSKEHIDKENEDGISILFYLQKIYPDEWDNFLQRLSCGKEGDVWKHEALWDNMDNELELTYWASTRGQTLFRTVRGMMYYWEALKLQTHLDTAEAKDILSNYDSFDSVASAIVDMKFTYVVSCQNYGAQKRSGDPHATDIQSLMIKYPCLRVAYIDEMEIRGDNHKIHKEYFSVLVKATNGIDEEIYRIKLPGPIKLGEGKPENQNHAIIFTRGEALQAIDMNQDNYLEEAFKMRNLLQEFDRQRGVHEATILGLREHIFTGSVSSLGSFMSLQETSFVTIGQRVLTEPLRTRFHYGHPDIFNRLFHITRGGISKASRVINLSEDIFAGFNSTLRQGSVTHHEYIQVGKGRDVGLNQISMFEAKVASGNGEQAISRDIFRLGQRFDFFRMLTCYFTTVGFYFSSLLVVMTVYVFLYGRVYLTLSGIEKSLIAVDLNKNHPLQAALASQTIVQLGVLMALPMVTEIGLEKGFWNAVSDFIIMQLQLASVFFTFSLGTKTHYFGRTILHGGARYQATGRGFVVKHERFAENYRLYSRSHFTKGLEIMALLIIYERFGTATKGLVTYLLVTFSMWFLVVSWLYGPFLFNPSGFDWQKIVEDWVDWNQWMRSAGGIGVPPKKSWESWWTEEQEHLKHTGFLGRIWETILLSRFLLYQYGLVYHLGIISGNKQIGVYGLSWFLIAALFLLLKVVSMGRHRLGADFQLLFRLLKAMLFLLSIALLVGLFFVFHFSFRDLFTCVLAFFPTGWGLLQMAQVWKPIVLILGFWESVKTLARGYEYLMGLVLFAPVAVLAWFPFISEFQSRLLFNQAFSRGLQISRILAGGKKG